MDLARLLAAATVGRLELARDDCLELRPAEARNLPLEVVVEAEAVVLDLDDEGPLDDPRLAVLVEPRRSRRRR